MNSSPTHPIEFDGERLYSHRFEDHYAGKHHPQEEKYFVFCEGNELPQRFQNCQQFTLGELGFGSGLGFLLTAKLWLDTAPADASLDYYSIERYPLTHAELATAHSAFPELADYAAELQRVYSGDNTGFHRLHLFDDRVRLTLIANDILDGLSQMQANIDAWYLDGFAPSKNPDMWQPAVFKAMNRLSNDTATFATYTAAGQVRRDLKAAGFTVLRPHGFRRKRERLVGHLSERTKQRMEKPWKQRPPPCVAGESITILGGGIAGCALANRLAARGKTITILEAEQQLAGGASSNPVAISHPHFTQDQNLASQFALQGFLYSQQTLQRLANKGLVSGFHATDMVVLPKSDKDRSRQEGIVADNPPSPSVAQWKSPDCLADVAGVEVKHEGWHLNSSGWASLPQLCHALVAEYAQHISVQTGILAADVQHNGQQWEILDQSGASVHRCTTLVLANGFAMRTFTPVAHLPLRANRGQVNYAYAPSHGARSILCAKGYTVPLDNHHLCFGSSYAPGETLARIDADNHADNILQLRAAFPTLADSLDDTITLDWSGIRTVLPDRFPILGAVAKAQPFIDLFAPMFRGEVQHRPDPVPLHPGLYLFTGLGSRSVVYSLMGAETLASDLVGAPSPLPSRVRDALDANRFLLRKSPK